MDLIWKLEALCLGGVCAAWLQSGGLGPGLSGRGDGRTAHLVQPDQDQPGWGKGPQAIGQWALPQIGLRNLLRVGLSGGGESCGQWPAGLAPEWGVGSQWLGEGLGEVGQPTLPPIGLWEANME